MSEAAIKVHAPNGAPKIDDVPIGNDLGRYDFKVDGSGRGRRGHYPWIAAEVGDWWMVVADGDPGRSYNGRNRVVNSLAACAWQHNKDIEWHPVFAFKEYSPRIVQVRRVA